MGRIQGFGVIITTDDKGEREKRTITCCHCRRVEAWTPKHGWCYRHNQFTCTTPRCNQICTDWGAFK